MEILRAENNEFAHLKNTNDPAATNTSSASSTIDDDDEERDDEFSTVSTTDDKRTKSPLANGMSDERNVSNHLEYQRHRERVAKELKDYEDRWLAHRNFLLYSQAFSMKAEDRERFFSQMNLSNNADDHSSHFQQQQIFARLSKDERDRFLAAAALYNPSSAPSQPFPFPHPYPWSSATSSAALALVPPAPLPSATTTTTTTAPTTTNNDQSQQPKSPSSDDSGNQSNSGSTTEWTFEEQFRQLYELSDEPKRKEFLDDLFAFMQKRGTPVNRIPIMAKHVLDLYELFRLVVGKGGLVEVINKKLWREVTKGLNLPSSITSAAFTLRTQYMKYLYPYECEKLQLSSPSELQAAIEGNRREGRRPSYAFEYSSPPQIMPPPAPPSSTYLASPLAHRSMDPNHSHDAMQHAAMAAAAALSHPFFLAAAAASSRDENSASTSSIPSVAATRLPSFNDHPLPMNKFLDRSPTTMKRSLSPNKLGEETKKPSLSSNRSSCFTPVTTTSAASPASKVKIIAKESQSDLSSLTISMELNGIIYQGVLYPNTSHD